MDQLTDQDRHAIVEDFLRSGLTQEANCKQLALRGLRIAPRTLRSWLTAFGPTKDFGAEYRATVKATIEKLQLLLSELEARDCRLAAEPAVFPETERAQHVALPAVSETQRPAGSKPATGTSTSAPQPMGRGRKLEWA